MQQRYPHVLIVDESVAERVSLENTLETVGYQVRTAPTGGRAVQLIQDKMPDYVILDHRVPDMNCQRLCRNIRSANSTNCIYIIVMVELAEMLQVVERLGASADDYISKPVDVCELLARMLAGRNALDLDKRLTDIAKHDPMTGMLNRRDLVTSVDRLIDISQRAERNSACVMVDIDHCESINANAGQAVGEEVPQQVAKLLRHEARSADFVCRFGGEDFVIVLPDCDEIEAFRFAERCRTEIQNKARSGPARQVVTASFGVADTSDGGDALELVNRADAALLHAKRAGRNRVQRFSELDPSEHLQTKPTLHTRSIIA